MTAGLVLETERLTLTPLARSDLDTFHALMVEPGVRRFLCDDQASHR